MRGWLRYAALSWRPPLLWMAVAFLLLFILLVLVRTETEIDRRRLEIAEVA